MHSLYPSIKPYEQYNLKVSPLHTLYVEENRQSTGNTHIGLHSGPGTGSDPYTRRFFDPQEYRIILFDQRGCGRSSPHLELQDNNTSALLEDINALRNHLG